MICIFHWLETMQTQTTHAQMLAMLNQDIINKFYTAIEIGKWADGRPLSADERATCMQAVVVWEHAHLPPEQHTGYIADKKECKGKPNTNPTLDTLAKKA